ncbi:MAG: hypothetical protein EAX89_16015 [Candidatus Lokiarchaeota archaeon]|nr:hypothetical protein [Candidatus Lokiarchaeota archaeon]
MKSIKYIPRTSKFKNHKKLPGINATRYAKYPYFSFLLNKSKNRKMPNITNRVTKTIIEFISNNATIITSSGINIFSLLIIY